MSSNFRIADPLILLLLAVMVATGGMMCAPVNCIAETARVDKAASDQAVDAWREMRFGMFIHWGPVSLTGTKMSWSRGKEVPCEEYDQLYTRFNPTEFDADEWVIIAKDTGMQYLVVTAKHHDGFCLWPTKYSDYHIGHTPFKRDVLRELSQACQKQGVQFCTYFSLPDWRDPDYPLGSPGGSTKKDHPNMPRFYQLIRNQTKELIANYGPLGVMWFDGDWEEPWTRDYGSDLYVELKQLQPSLVINNRVAKSRPGVAQAAAQRLPNSGDYDTPEQRIGSFDREFPWETCMTLAVGDSWSWNPNEDLKTLKECLQSLLQTVGGDGNFLFNVGPMPDGRIDPRQVARLREMGDWLQKYGDGVYGTRGGPFKPGMWGAATCKGDRVSLYVMKWPSQGPLHLPPIEAHILATRTLSGGEADVRQDETGIYIEMPVAERDEIATVIELTVDGKAFDIKPVDVAYRSGSLAHGKNSTASNVFYNEAQYGAGAATDDDNSTRWATDSGSSPAWLAVDLGAPTAIGRIIIDEPEEYQRIEKFALQSLDGNEWTTFYSGTTIGPEFSVSVKPVTTRHVRLHVSKTTDGPTIREFQIFGPASEDSTVGAN